jgi:uncharacterized protein YjdB
MKILTVTFLLLFSSIIGNAATYYVSTSGSDSNTGTYDKPWATLQKAVDMAKAGDVVYIRGGIYYPAKSVNWIPNEAIGKDGTPSAPIRFLNYQNESPVFDFINCPPEGNYNSGFYLNTADYIHLKGMTIKNVKQTRNYVECIGLYAYDCTNLRFENVTVCDIDGNAFRFFGAWRYPGTQPYLYPEHANYPADSTFFINCDAYNCADSLPRTENTLHIGGAADGYKTHNEAGSYILFEGCRAWKCSDDGFDPSGEVRVELKNCWSFENGFLDGDGAGFKTGGLYNSTPVLRIVTNCIAALNSSYGFILLEYPDYYRTNARFYNNVAFKNVFGFGFSRNEDRPNVLGVWRNNVSYKNTSQDFSNAYAVYTESNNSWDLVDGYPGYAQSAEASVSDADFKSINAAELKTPRQANGKLPVINFFQLVKSSDLIDKGVDVGLPYKGTAPDIGYCEYAIQVTGIVVSGENGFNTITTDNGTLQLIAAVTPNDALNRSVTWSITNGTGQASISSTGLVTAITNGTVTARATAKDGSGIYGQMVITISNQSDIPVASIAVTGAGGATTIVTDKGTLQLTATVSPDNAKNKTVTWSVINGTGKASINTTGLVTAGSNGTITARATANDNSNVFGELTITISNQIVKVTGITVTGAGGSASISTYGGTLQLSAAILPVNATNKNITWSVINGTGQASINSTGLVTAISNGTVTAKALAADGSNVSGQLVLTITNQIIGVTGITVTGTGGATVINSITGTLQMIAAILPANASNKNVTWSLVNGTGQASISNTGLVTAISAGTVTARATAADGSNVYGTLVITISSQSVKVSGITISAAGGSTTIVNDNGTLQLNATVLPSNASNKNVTWSLVNATGQASISNTGLVTAISNGTIKARATANDGSNVYGELGIIVSNQIISVTAITVTGTGGSSIINTNNGTLQMIANITPANATNKTVKWSVTNGTGQASISGGGTLRPIENGVVTVIATASDGSGITGSCTVTITNQKAITGVEEQENKAPWVYQSSGLLIIQTNSYVANHLCSIYSMNGSIMHNEKIYSESLFIDISSYSKGIYIITFQGDQNIAPIKFVVQ